MLGLLELIKLIKNALRITFIVIIIIPFSNKQIYSQLNPEWVQTYNGTGNNNDEALDHYIDDSGNIFVTGKIFQTSTLFDIYVVKYNFSGNLLWDKIYNGPANGNDIANSITVDLNGNIYVAGESRGVKTSGDFVLLKYDSLGNELWTRRYNGKSNSTDVAVKVITDKAGNPIISGRSFEFPTLSDIVTIKYNSNGDIIWSKKYNGASNSNDFVGDMAIDSSENLYISGSSFIQGSGDNFLIIKYDNNGDTLWTESYNGPGNGNDNSVSLAMDVNGNVIITGSSVASGTGIDFATLKYSDTGEMLWQRRFASSANTSPDEPKSITTDLNGNIYVTGTSVEFYSYDYLTVKYSPSGDELWTRRYNGPSAFNFDEPRSITTDNSENVFVAGLSEGTGSMDDIVIIKYDATGNEIWLNRYNSPAGRNDVANNISVDVSGNIIVSGFIAGTSSLNDFGVIKFSQLTNLNQNTNQTASEFYLAQNYPNPFNPTTLIEFSTMKTSEINLTIYDINGRVIQTIVNKTLNPGQYRYEFNATGLSGGIYFYKLKTDDQEVTKKLILLK